MENNLQLEKIANILGTKYSTVLNFNSKVSEFTSTFPIPLQLDPNFNYEIGLLWFTTYNTVFNINKENNCFQIIWNGKEETFRIMPGAYEFKILFETIRNMIIEKFGLLVNVKAPANAEEETILKKKISPVDFEIHMPTARIQLNLKDGYSIKFVNNLNKVLGFKQKEYKVSTMGENNVDISNINSINILCDLVAPSYQDGKHAQIIYNFPYGSVPHGYRIIEKPSTPIYMPVINKSISSINFKIVCQNGNVIDFNGENISFSLHLKQV